MFDGRKRKIAAAVFVTTMTGGVLTATSTTAQAKPDIDAVKTTVDHLYRQAEIASEHYNAARDYLKTSSKTLQALKADLHRQQAKVDRMRDGVASMVVRQYQGGGLSTASKVLLSDNPDSFLDSLNAMAAYNTQRTESMGQYTVELTRLHQRLDAVRQETRAVAATKRKMAEAKAEIDDKAAAAKHKLESLKAAQRRRLQAQQEQAAPAPATTTAPASGRAAVAVNFAMAQVGEPYVYGAAGPDAWDCSGLTMGAWGAAGVGLPHSSSAQMSYGTPVSESELQPGDLVFYYQPVSHVAMYIGNGMVVGAQNPSTGVQVVPVNSMPFSGARRL